MWELREKGKKQRSVQMVRGVLLHVLEIFYYMPWRYCFLLRAALCIIFEHCLHTYIFRSVFYNSTYSNIEKNCELTVLTFFRDRVCRWVYGVCNNNMHSNARHKIHTHTHIAIVCVWVRSRSYLFNNYFDSSTTRTRNLTWPPAEYAFKNAVRR